MHSSLEQIQEEATNLSDQLAEVLKQKDLKIVFAESCTAGLVSALLARTPGISSWHCGSAVVYQVETKVQWLEIDPYILVDPGPVSEIVAQKMCKGVLGKTSQAQISASITGHLGPDAPPDEDGLVYIGVSQRSEEIDKFRTVVTEHWLSKMNDLEAPLESETELRLYRQYEAVTRVMNEVLAVLSQ